VSHSCHQSSCFARVQGRSLEFAPGHTPPLACGADSGGLWRTDRAALNVGSYLFRGRCPQGTLASVMFIGGPELVFSLLLPIAVLGLLALVAGVVFRGGGLDRTGRRPLALYLLAVMLVTLFTAVFSVFRAASAAVRAAVEPIPYHVAMYASEGLVGVGTGGVTYASSPPEEFPVPPEADGPVLGELPPEAFLEPFPQERPAAEVVEALITAILAGSVFAFHLRRLRRLIGTEAGGG
jgi:hypothetical protein